MNAIEIHGGSVHEATRLGLALEEALATAGLLVGTNSSWGAALSAKEQGRPIESWLGLGGDPSRIGSASRGMWESVGVVARRFTVIECCGALGLFAGHEAALEASTRARRQVEGQGQLSVLDVALGSPSQWSEAFASALARWAPDAVRAESAGPEAVALILKALGVSKAGLGAGGLEQSQRASEATDFELKVSSLGPAGYGSMTMLATASGRALEAWEKSRGRAAGSGAVEFARLALAECERRGWGPQPVEMPLGESKGFLRLAPRPGEASPTQLWAGQTELARAVEASSAQMGIRPRTRRM
jgi:hypothetical protein